MESGIGGDLSDGIRLRFERDLNVIQWRLNLVAIRFDGNLCDLSDGIALDSLTMIRQTNGKKAKNV